MRCGERNGLRQALEPCCDPAAVAFREGARLLHAAAQRHGEHHRAVGGVHTQRIAPRLPMPAQLHRIDRAVERNLDQLWIGRSAEEERAQRHGR
jgi:hypothetical protein